MNFFTSPRGVKIRIPVREAFTIMARLYPKRKPEDIMRTVEGIESLPSLFSTVSILMGLFMGLSWWAIIILSGFATLLAMIMINVGALISHKMTIAYYYSFIPFYIRYLLLFVLGYFAFSSWYGILIVIGAKLCSTIAQYFYEYQLIKKFKDHKVTFAEVIFIQAFRLNAVSIGVEWREEAYDEEEEKNSDKWKKPFEEYINKYPHTLGW
ncbi:hypothetical protein GCM10010965_31410 [Caldalkalibacillus thermarum]|uniref:hypothetical protein n=1 Tax=Caldalkalibacillus thermarum TaxID=296745 RepID=UPI00166A396B|nr:hypothetical protein [Caldalkalibacillus thermarum]GGK36160.1 hypothetical protein GCM10010965_31410 [Caldalkalibacillus thermarum]